MTRTAVHTVVGPAAILNLRPLLVEFSIRCGQPGTMEDLQYFLQKPGLLQRVPRLFLLATSPETKLHDLRPEDLEGVLLLYEYRVLGLGTQTLATNDRSGRGTLLAPPDRRFQVAVQLGRLLLERGARVVMLSFRDTQQDSASDCASSQGEGPLPTARALCAVRHRSVPAFLPLRPTLDETLATLGQKTRSNMRYYRRRAQKDLGCIFLPAAQISPRDCVRFNRECMYPVPERVARWRLKVMPSLTHPFLMGLQDRDGRWLSLLGGRRFGGTSEILWQMNRRGLPNHSLGTVMRLVCLEHEIELRAQRFQIEGGTSGSIVHSFVEESITDLAFVRSSSRTLVQRAARHFVPGDNLLAEMLNTQDLPWHLC